MISPRHAMAGLIGSLLLIACGREAGNETEKVNDRMNENRKELAKADDSKEWLEERREATEELRDLRENLNDRLIREQKRLADGIKDTKKRAECESHINELKMNIDRIDRTVVQMEGGAETDWQRIKAEGRTVADSTKNWWNRNTEWIDKKTDADADRDGH